MSKAMECSAAHTHTRTHMQICFMIRNLPACKRSTVSRGECVAEKKKMMLSFRASQNIWETKEKLILFLI